MNKPVFDVRGYLASAEKRYNFNGDDETSGFSNMHTDLSFSGATGPQPAMTAQQIAASSTPYQIDFTNTTTGTLQAILFGSNIYYNQDNNGSDTGIEVTMGTPNVRYSQLLMQSAMEPFEINLLRISSSNTAQPQQGILLTQTDASGNSLSSPFVNTAYVSPYQQQLGIVDIVKRVRVNGNVYFSFNIYGSTTVSLFVFLAAKVNPGMGLVAGGNQMQQFGAPAAAMGLPIYNPAALNGKF